MRKAKESLKLSINETAAVVSKLSSKSQWLLCPVWWLNNKLIAQVGALWP